MPPPRLSAALRMRPGTRWLPRRAVSRFSWPLCGLDVERRGSAFGWTWRRELQAGPWVPGRDRPPESRGDPGSGGGAVGWRRRRDPRTGLALRRGSLSPERRPGQPSVGLLLASAPRCLEEGTFGPRAARRSCCPAGRPGPRLWRSRLARPDRAGRAAPRRVPGPGASGAPLPSPVGPARRGRGGGGWMRGRARPRPPRSFPILPSAAPGRRCRGWGAGGDTWNQHKFTRRPFFIGRRGGGGSRSVGRSVGGTALPSGVCVPCLQAPAPGS